MGAALLLAAEAVSARCAYAGLVALEPILGLAAQGVWGECALELAAGGDEIRKWWSRLTSHAGVHRRYESRFELSVLLGLEWT
jgi:hypothetical protein